jgi:hypothetical protein
LYAAGFVVGKTTVARLLRQAGYRLQATFKTKEGAQHPDRDAQFGHINTVAGMFLAAGDPVISVDTKKKELIGEYANRGREWQPTGQPEQVNGHDFPTGVPKAIPYGVYDVGVDDGFISVGVDHDTAAFAVNAIRTWWYNVGRDRYPAADRLLITADCGGSNGNRPWAWKARLAELAAESGLQVTVCHFPPGTSKWNKVEHRLFSFISINWRGRPLTDYQVVVETIAATTTRSGADRGGGAGHQPLPDRCADPSRAAEGDPVAEVRLPWRVELHHPLWTDPGISTEQRDPSRIDQIINDRARRAEICSLTGRVLACPLDEMNRPRGRGDIGLRIPPG